MKTRSHFISPGFLFLSFYLASAGAVAASVSQVIKIGRDRQKIAVSHAESRKWKVDEQACVFRAGKSIVCGTVLKSSSNGAIVQLDARSSAVANGDEVHRGAGSRRRPAATLLDSVDHPAKGSTVQYDLTAGINVGFNYFFPSLNFQVSLGPHFSFGLVPIFFSASSDSISLSAVGGYGTLNYYSGNYFRDFWVQAGGGLFMLSTSDSLTGTSEKANSPAFIVTLGWRSYWDFGLNIGLGAGGEYIKSPNFQTTDVNSAGLQALFVLDAGFNF